MITIQALSENNCTAMKNICPVNILVYLDKALEKKDRVIVNCACINGDLAGYMIAAPNENNSDSCVICQISIFSTIDSKSVFSALLNETEQNAKKNGYKLLEIKADLAIDNNFQTYLQLINTIHESHYWDPLQLNFTTCYIHTRKIRNRPWYTIDTPAPYEIVLWNTLSEDELLHLHNINHTCLDSYFLDPFVVDNIDTLTSFCARDTCTGNIAGWMITMPISKDVLVFRRLFVLPEYRSKGLFYPLLSNSIEKMLKYYKTAQFTVIGQNRKMYSAIERMMGELLDFRVASYYSRKKLDCNHN